MISIGQVSVRYPQNTPLRVRGTSYQTPFSSVVINDSGMSFMLGTVSMVTGSIQPSLIMVSQTGFHAAIRSYGGLGQLDLIFGNIAADPPS